MTFSLHTLHSSPHSTRRKKRVGRGNASGHGTYSGKGQKGQRARSGKGRERLRRLGMKKLVQSTPKSRGFRSLAVPGAVVNVGALERQYAAGSIVTLRVLKQSGLVRNEAHSAKILGEGTLTKKLTIRGCAASASAKEKIEKAGGKIERGSVISNS